MPSQSFSLWGFLFTFIFKEVLCHYSMKGWVFMDALSDIRIEIDNIDRQLIRLLAQRQILVEKAGLSAFTKSLQFQTFRFCDFSLSNSRRTISPGWGCPWFGTARSPRWRTHMAFDRAPHESMCALCHTAIRSEGHSISGRAPGSTVFCYVPFPTHGYINHFNTEEAKKIAHRWK